jgi:hypothetical protein
MEIINLTPHTVNMVSEEGVEISRFISQGEARCKQSIEKVGEINGILITETQFGEVYGLPDEKEGTYYIVSRLVMQACNNRNDLLVPNEIVRDMEGKIIGCKSFSRN